MLQVLVLVPGVERVIELARQPEHLGGSLPWLVSSARVTSRIGIVKGVTNRANKIDPEVTSSGEPGHL